MNDINQLQQLLQFYDKNIGGNNQLPYFAGGTWNSPGGENRPGLQWAMEFMRNNRQPERPDFFGGQPGQQMPAYTQPRQVDMNAPRPMPEMRSNYFQNDPVRGGVQNYLARLLPQATRYSGAS